MQGMQETLVRSLSWEDPQEKEIATHSSTLAWEIRGQRSLVGYSPRGCKEPDTTEQLSTHAHSVYAAETHTVNSVVKSAALSFH